MLSIHIKVYLPIGRIFMLANHPSINNNIKQHHLKISDGAVLCIWELYADFEGIYYCIDTLFHSLPHANLFLKKSVTKNIIADVSTIVAPVAVFR